jgi:hypothetical protein
MSKAGTASLIRISGSTMFNAGSSLTDMSSNSSTALPFCVACASLGGIRGATPRAG